MFFLLFIFLAQTAEAQLSRCLAPEYVKGTEPYACGQCEQPLLDALIGPDGKIIAKGLKGIELIKKIRKALKINDNSDVDTTDPK